MWEGKSPYPDRISEYWGIEKPEGRFNDWGERKWIAATEEKQGQVELEIQARNLLPRAIALYRAARLTDSSGVEFVMITNAQFPQPVPFQSQGIHIVPCFVPLHLTHGFTAEKRQSAMMKKGQFIYDGWVANEDWSSEKISEIVDELDRITNTLSVISGYQIFWEPKYNYSRGATTSYMVGVEEFANLANTVAIVKSLPIADQQALSRSAAWVADALRDFSAAKRFLLLFVSIEALVTYIERDSDKDSPLRQFAADRLSRSERKQKRETCIQEVLASGMDLTAAVQEAYFKCVVGNKILLENHLDRVFGNDQVSTLIFREEISGKTMWKMRNDIAHGTLNLTDEQTLSLFAQRAVVLDEIARTYLQVILVRLANTNFFPRASFPISTIAASHSIGTPQAAYMGPTDMAEYYANVEQLSSSFIRITT